MSQKGGKMESYDGPNRKQNMSDVAQILGLSAGGGSFSAAAGGADAVAKELETLKPTGGGSVGNALRAKAKKPKKLTGMQREVLELLESNHRVNHALYPGVNKMTLQQKWKERKDRPAVKWLRKSFQNPARVELAGEQERQGGLTLSHWVKAHIDPPDYVFARFNVKCDVLKYTDEEYEAVVATHVDPVMKWTKEETNALFELCDRHDLRWLVVADRYNLHTVAAKATPRTVEDIKYRYYEVARLVSEYRDRTEDAAHATSTTGTTAPIDTVKTEDTTTDAAASGSSVTSTETPATTPVEPTPVAVPASTSDDATPSKYYRFNIVYEKQRKRQLDLGFNRSAEEENEVKKLSDELRLVEQQLKKVAVKVDTKKKKELSDVPFQIQREYPKGVFLRSQMLALPSQHQKSTAISAKMLKKLELMLEEMGVPQRPMPTKLTCEMFDTLRQDVIGLLSLCKHIASKQADAVALKERYQALTGLEYKSTTPVLPSHKTVRRPDLAANAAATAGAGSDGAATAQVSKGKSLKTAEKQFRVSSKRRGSSAAPGTASKRNKKHL